jgi:hypothetical protein
MASNERFDRAGLAQRPPEGLVPERIQAGGPSYH